MCYRSEFCYTNTAPVHPRVYEVNKEVQCGLQQKVVSKDVDKLDSWRIQEVKVMNISGGH